MGLGVDPVRSDRCPWALVATDAETAGFLAAHWLVKEYGKWPPGREDPRVLEAIAVIAEEHARLTREQALLPPPVGSVPAPR